MAAQALKLATEHMVFSEVVTDQEAVKAVELFAGDLLLDHVFTSGKLPIQGADLDQLLHLFLYRPREDLGGTSMWCRPGSCLL